MSQRLSSRINHGCLSKHADFDSIDVHVRHQRVDLFFDKIGADGGNIRDFLGILRGQCRDHRASEGFKCAHGLDIRQDASTARGIQASDGQRVGYA